MTLQELQSQWDALSPSKRRQLVGTPTHSIVFWSPWAALTEPEKQRLLQWAKLARDSSSGE